MRNRYAIIQALPSAMKKITTPVNANGRCLQSPGGEEAGGSVNQKERKK